jgi:hypothetical protein
MSQDRAHRGRAIRSWLPLPPAEALPTWPLKGLDTFARLRPAG